MSKIHIKNRYLFLFDVLSCLLAYIAIVMVAYPLASFATCFFSSMRITLVTAIIYAAVLTVYNTYNTDWVNAGMKNYLKLIAACATAMAVNTDCFFILRSCGINGKYNLLDAKLLA